MSEIQAIIRQITASVSFLPLLEEQCAFDLLVYTDKNSEVPAMWEESDPRFIKDSAEVRLRSFSTKVGVGAHTYPRKLNCTVILMQNPPPRAAACRSTRLTPWSRTRTPKPTTSNCVYGVAAGAHLKGRNLAVTVAYCILLFFSKRDNTASMSLVKFSLWK